MTVRLIEGNFAENRMHRNLSVFPLEIREFWRISEKFAIITRVQCCWRPNCHYCWKRKGNVFQLVWSTAPFVSLTIHSMGWEDNDKLMNGPIATSGGVLVCCLKSFFFFVFFFKHSCVKNCIHLSRVKTELLKRSFYPWHLHYSSGPGCSDVL